MNLRPLRPERSALPSCATPRKVYKSITHVEIKGQIGLSAVGRGGIHFPAPGHSQPNQSRFPGHILPWSRLPPILIQASERHIQSPSFNRFSSLSLGPPDSSAIVHRTSSRASFQILIKSRAGSLGVPLPLFPIAPWPYASAGACSAASNSSASRRLSASSLRAMIRWSVEMARVSPSLAILIAISSRLSW